MRRSNSALASGEAAHRDASGTSEAIKSHAGYTQAIGEDLDIIAEGEAFDPNTVKSAIKVTVLPGEVVVAFPKGDLDGSICIAGWKDRQPSPVKTVQLRTAQGGADFSAPPFPFRS